MVPLVGIVAPLSSLSFSKSVCMYVCYTAYILVCKCIHVYRYASMKVYVCMNVCGTSVGLCRWQLVGCIDFRGVYIGHKVVLVANVNVVVGVFEVRVAAL